MTIPKYRRPEPPLPEFERPPVVEVSVGVQFVPHPAFRSVEVAPLRELWRGDYPDVEEQAPLAPTIEMEPGAFPDFQVFMGPAPSRLWFISADRCSLVQLQPDRLHVNWREAGSEPHAYPRWEHVRQVFVDRLHEAFEFARRSSEGLAPVIRQVEVSFINAIEKDGGSAPLESVLRSWSRDDLHHLGQPREARANLVFEVEGAGRAPVRLYAEVGPGLRATGHMATFLTLTFRGAPVEDDIESAVLLADQGHDHIVRSFAELTPRAMHGQWGKRQ